MKKHTPFLILLMFHFMILNAQNDKQLDYKNNFEFNPLSALLFGNFEFQYERAISNKSTLSLALGLKVSGGISKINGFNSSIIKTDNFEFIGITITPEYRWYFQKNVNKRTGFYLGSYYKFKNVDDNISGSYTIIDNPTPFQVNVNITAHTFGALLGYKVMAGKHLYFDIIIAGPGYSSVKLHITEKINLEDEFYHDILSLVFDNSNIDDFIDGIEKEVPQNNDNGTFRFNLPAFRYGFKIGYSF